jgi:PhzF family phenazine biosynthesis protein
MQQIAAQNNLAETAFIMFHRGKNMALMVHPSVEVDLCGHATLATAHVLFNHLNYGADQIVFHSKADH